MAGLASMQAASGGQVQPQQIGGLAGDAPQPLGLRSQKIAPKLLTGGRVAATRTTVSGNSTAHSLS